MQMVVKSREELWDTDRLISFQKLVSSHRPIQARLPHVDVGVRREGGEERQESSRVQVVIIINMTKPPGIQNHVNKIICLFNNVSPKRKSNKILA